MLNQISAGGYLPAFGLDTGRRLPAERTGRTWLLAPLNLICLNMLLNGVQSRVCLNSGNLASSESERMLDECSSNSQSKDRSQNSQSEDRSRNPQSKLTVGRPDAASLIRAFISHSEMQLCRLRNDVLIVYSRTLEYQLCPVSSAYIRSLIVLLRPPETDSESLWDAALLAYAASEEERRWNDKNASASFEFKINEIWGNLRRVSWNSKTLTKKENL